MSEAPKTGLPAALPGSIGTPFIELQSVDSTNNYAREQILAKGLPERQAGRVHGLTLFAHEQVAGRGQRGRVWSAEKDMNITMSVIIDPQPLGPGDQFSLSAAVALATREFFLQYALDKVTVKWPNDLYWQDRKAGGILIESGIGNGSGANSGWNWAIIGIGININQTHFPDFLPNPVSLKQITGSDYKVVPLARELCRYLDKYIGQLQEKGPAPILRSYNEALYKRGQTVRFRKGNRRFEALVRGVDTEGKLLLQHSMEESFRFGELEWEPGN